MFCPDIIQHLIGICIQAVHLIFVFLRYLILIIVAHQYQTCDRQFDLMHPYLDKILEIIHTLPVLPHMLCHGFINLI